MKYSLPEIIVFATAAVLPTYLIRFHIGPFPTTLLEVVILVAIVAMIVQITHPHSAEASRGRPTLSYLKGEDGSNPPLRVRGGRRGYESRINFCTVSNIVYIAPCQSRPFKTSHEAIEAICHHKAFPYSHNPPYPPLP